jgi:hypothetical protein
MENKLIIYKVANKFSENVAKLKYLEIIVPNKDYVTKKLRAD